MKAAPIFRGRIAAGKLKLDHREDFAALVRRIEGKEIDLVLRLHRCRRSPSQNAWYWGCVVPVLAEHCGYDAEEMHEALKWRFLKKHDGPLATVRSTADLSTAEMTEFIEKVRRLAAELGCSIPNPDQVS